MFFRRARKEVRLDPPPPVTEPGPAARPAASESDVVALFTPASPIVKHQLFAGRRDAIYQLVEAALERSRHAVLYGERGVGKTSLANMFWQCHAAVRASLAVRIQADPSDDFSSLWRKAFQELGERSGLASQTTPADAGGPLTPDQVRRHLASYCRGSTILIIDEIDRFTHPNDSLLMANLLKHLSDYGVNCTVIMVGVAETASDLVADHASLRRCLAWVPLHRMCDGEMTELLESRLDRLNILCDREVTERIVTLSRGLPFYAHSIAKEASLSALRHGLRRIELARVDEAADALAGQLQPSFRDDYLTAVSGTAGNLFPQVLLACALAQADPDGYFTAAGVGGALARILRRPVHPAGFQRHLVELSSKERGRILVKRGMARDYRFRFRDSLIHPYLVIEGIRTGLVRRETALSQLERRASWTSLLLTSHPERGPHDAPAATLGEPAGSVPS